MNINEINRLVTEITYKPNWSINLHTEDARPYIQLSVTNSIDSVSRETCAWKSGKRYLSFHMCRQEIIGICFGLIESAEIHEMREWFRYRGASIYNPHIDPDVLVEVARKASSFNCRDNAMDMTE